MCSRGTICQIVDLEYTIVKELRDIFNFVSYNTLPVRRCGRLIYALYPIASSNVSQPYYIEVSRIRKINHSSDNLDLFNNSFDPSTTSIPSAMTFIPSNRSMASNPETALVRSMALVPSTTSNLPTTSEPSKFQQNGVTLHGKAQVLIKSIQCAQSSEGKVEQNVAVLGPGASIVTGSKAQYMQFGQGGEVIQRIIKAD